jgi:hypothetical protein
MLFRRYMLGLAHILAQLIEAENKTLNSKRLKTLLVYLFKIHKFVNCIYLYSSCLHSAFISVLELARSCVFLCHINFM